MQSQILKKSAIQRCSAVFVIVGVLACFFVNSQSTLLVGALLLGAYAVLGLIKRPSLGRELYLVVAFSACMIPIFLSFDRDLNVVFYYLSTLFAFFAARRMASYDGLVLLRAFQASYGFLFVVCIFLYWLHRADAEPFGAIIEGASTNGIPSYFIVLQITLSLVTYSETKRLPLYSGALTMVIAVLGIGRGSILAAALILALSLVFNFFRDVYIKRWSKVLFLLGLCCVVMLVVIANFDEIYDYAYSRTNLSRGLYDSARADMIDDYLSKISVSSLFLGASFEGTVISHLYGNNPHNSFIRAHSYLGLGPLLMVIFAPVCLLFSRGKRSSRIVFFTFTSMVLLRAVSEPILFPTLLDFFYFIIFFLYFRGASNSTVAGRSHVVTN